MCSSLNIIVGFDNGKFMPNESVTREQMAKMICILDNGGKEPQLATGSTFSDVAADRWSNKYIEACASRGVVVGIGGGKFAPAGKVTATQAAKMLLVELGYDDDIQQYSGSDWATKVNVDATKKGYYNDLEDIDVNEPLTREHAAQMVWNALQAKEVEYDYTLIGQDGNLSSNVKAVDKYITLLEDKYGAKCDDSAQMIGFTYNSDKEEWTYYFGDTFTGDYSSYTKFTSSQDYTDLYGQNVKVVYTEKTNGSVDKVFGMFSDDSVVLASGYVGDFDTVEATDDSVTISDADYDTYTTADDTLVYIFTYGKDSFTAQTADSIFDVVEDPANKGFEICAIDYDDNGDIDFFVMKVFIVDQVDSMATKTFTLADTEGSFKYDDVNYYDGMAEDDFVVYTAAQYTTINKDTFTPVDSVLDGKVDATKGNYKFSVDGTWYESTQELGLKPGNNVKDAPVVNGYVFDGSAANTSNVEDYAVVIATDNGAYASTAKLLFSDGSKKVVDTDVYYNNLDSTLVYFEINSDDEYELTPASDQIDETQNKNDTGFDTYVDQWASGDFKNGESGKVKYIDGNNINDDAVIFFHDEDGYKVITGAQLKTISGDMSFYVEAFVEDNSDTGYSSVVVGYVSTEAPTQAADVTYGFVLDNPVSVKNSDNKNVYEYTIWTEEGKEVTLQTKDTNVTAAEEGDLISFNLNSDGNISKITLLNVEDFSASTGGFAYVSAWDGTYLQVDGGSDRYEVTSDTTQIYINVADSEGSTSGSIQKAAKSSDGYYDNVYLIVDDDEVDVIFIDINKDIHDAM